MATSPTKRGARAPTPPKPAQSAAAAVPPLDRVALAANLAPPATAAHTEGDAAAGSRAPAARSTGVPRHMLLRADSATALDRTLDGVSAVSAARALAGTASPLAMAAAAVSRAPLPVIAPAPLAPTRGDRLPLPVAGGTATPTAASPGSSPTGGLRPKMSFLASQQLHLALQQVPAPPTASATVSAAPAFQLASPGFVPNAAGLSAALGIGMPAHAVIRQLDSSVGAAAAAATTAARPLPGQSPPRGRPGAARAVATPPAAAVRAPAAPAPVPALAPAPEPITASATLPVAIAADHAAALSRKPSVRDGGVGGRATGTGGSRPTVAAPPAPARKPPVPGQATTAPVGAGRGSASSAARSEAAAPAPSVGSYARSSAPTHPRSHGYGAGALPSTSSFIAPSSAPAHGMASTLLSGAAASPQPVSAVEPAVAAVVAHPSTPPLPAAYRRPTATDHNGDGAATGLAGFQTTLRMHLDAACEAIVTGLETDSRTTAGSAPLPPGMWLVSQATIASLVQSVMAETAVAVGDAAAGLSTHLARSSDVAVRGAVASMELALTEAQRRVETERLHVVELESALTASQVELETKATAWAEEKARLMREAESGFSQLTANITDKAQEVIKQLRSELNAAMTRADEAQARALREAHALIASADAAREESTARSIGGYERTVAALRAQLEAQTAAAAASVEELQKQVLERLTSVEADRRQWEARMEAASQAAIRAAQEELVEAKTELKAARARIAEVEAAAEVEIEARCKAFESRLRAKISSTIADARKKQALATAAHAAGAMNGGTYGLSTPPPAVAAGSGWAASGSGGGLSSPAAPASPVSAPATAPPSPVPMAPTTAGLASNAGPLTPAGGRIEADDPMAAVLAMMTAEERALWHAIASSSL